MIAPTAFFLSSLLMHPGGLLGTELPPPDPSLAPAMETQGDTRAVSAQDAAALHLRLVAEPFDPLEQRAARDLLLAQRRTTPRRPASASPPPQAVDTETLPGSSSTSPGTDSESSTGGSSGSGSSGSPAGASTHGGSSDSGSESCSDIDCDTYHEAERNSSYVLHRRASLLRTHRAFALAAWSAMIVTEALGTLQAINQDTWFGRGNCAGDPSSFGCRDSSLITGLHETAAFITTGLYTTAGVLAVAAPDPENASEGDGTAESTLRLHKILALIHGTGMAILPLLGIASMTPQIFGVGNDSSRADFSRAMRSIHTIVGYTTFAALTFSGYLELF